MPPGGKEYTMKIWIYCRVANKTDAFTDPCEPQRMMLLHYAAEKGWLVIGASGEIAKGIGLDRPGLKAAEDAVRQGLADRVLITQADRISRDWNEVLKWRGRLKAWGGDLLTKEETDFFLYEKVGCYFKVKCKRKIEETN